MSATRRIRIAAAVVDRADGRTLLVRKRGTRVFIQPGGKIEPHEEPLAALLRELAEEIGISFDPSEAEYLGRFSAIAANEPDSVVDAHVFLIRCDGPIAHAAEIEETVWVGPADLGDLIIAPLTREQILPMRAGLLDTPRSDP